MPNAALTSAIKEAYASAPSNVVVLDTIQVSHPSLGSSLWLVRNLANITATLETAAEQEFTACGFRMALPSTGDRGLQELTIEIDNVNRVASDFIASVKNSTDPVTITYRPYLSTDLSTPQMDPPLVLYLSDVVITAYSVQGRASFANLLNRQFPNERYLKRRFPSLANSQ